MFGIDVSEFQIILEQVIRYKEYMINGRDDDSSQLGEIVSQRVFREMKCKIRPCNSKHPYGYGI